MSELTGGSNAPSPVAFREAVRTWARIAALSFGGPAGQIAVMHRILVEEKRWIGETRFLHALNYCMLLPGPEAHQLAVYIGWLMHRVRGGILAGTLFVLPGVVTLGILSWAYAVFGQIGFVNAIFFGMKAAVLAIVLEAVLRIGRRALRSFALIAIAALAFVAIFFFAIPFPVIILSAALIGLAGRRFAPDWFQPGGIHAAHSGEKECRAALIDTQFSQEIPDHVRRSAKRALAVAVVGAIVWFAPLAVLLGIVGAHNVLTSVTLFNSKMAVLTFGGAYAVLAYMAQQAVQHYHWLKPGEMLVGLGFAETTPGPLISVVQFVGFMAAYREPGALDPVVAGSIGGLLAMWATFVPSFLWIFLGGPYVEALIGNRAIGAALSAITAAVVGVVLNLAVWFALHVLFMHVDQMHIRWLVLNTPQLSSIDWRAIAIALFAMIAIFRFRLGMIPVLAASCALGLFFYLTLGDTVAVAQDAPKSPLALEASIPLPDAGGRIDHMAYDSARERVFVAELGNGSVDVVDLHARKVVHRFTNLDEPQGAAFAAQADVVAIASGGDGAVRLYAGSDYALRATIRLGDDADNARADPRNDHIVVGYGEGALAIIDPRTSTKIGDIALPAHPEAFQLVGNRAFVNIPDAREIDVVDLDGGKIVARWPTAPLESNFPMALDDRGRVAVAFRSPATLGLFDPADGRRIASIGTCGDADDVYFDAKRQRFYVSCGEGAIDIVAVSATGLREVGRQPTSWGARTSLFLPELNRLLVAERAGLFGSRAILAVFQIPDLGACDDGKGCAGLAR